MIKLKLKEILKARGISQKELAALTGLSRVYLSDVMNGKKMPKVETLEDIASKLEIDFLDLFEDNRDQEELKTIYTKNEDGTLNEIGFIKKDTPTKSKELRDATPTIAATKPTDAKDLTSQSDSEELKPIDLSSEETPTELNNDDNARPFIPAVAINAMRPPEPLPKREEEEESPKGE